jgi:hypothetical protein
MKISHVESRTGNDLVLHQEPEGGFLLFTKRIHLTLNVHEKPESLIAFVDTSHIDFDFYQGYWEINPSSTGHGFDVTYDLDAQQNFSAPAFIASDAVCGGAKDLLKKVREEILKRKNTPSKTTTPSSQQPSTPSAQSTNTPTIQLTPSVSPTNVLTPTPVSGEKDGPIH